MLYLILSILSIVIALKASKAPNLLIYKKLLKIAFGIIFFLWGFEYFNTVDYTAMLHKFNTVRDSHKYTNIEFNFDDIEPITWLILWLCQPIGNLGYYILVAFIEVFILYHITKEIIPKQVVWLLFMILLLGSEYIIHAMTLKRQFFSVCILLYSCFILNSTYKYKWVYASLIILIAFNIHRSAFIGILLLPMAYFNKKLSFKTGITLIVVYILHFFVTLSTLSNFLHPILENISPKFARYTIQLQFGNQDQNIIYILYDIVIMLLLIYTNNKCNQKERLFTFGSFIYLTLNGFFVDDLGRMLDIYRFCVPIAILIALSKLPYTFKEIYKFIIIFTIMTCIHSVYKIYISSENTPISMTYGIKEYRTIFEAPSMQINNPEQERRKYQYERIKYIQGR